jgi:hypothetical protein
MDWNALYVLAAGVLNALIIGIWKPWGAAYAAEKVKHFARKEDLDAILAEVKAVTASQEEIKFKLSTEQWERQMIATERKSVYGNLLTTVHQMLSSCANIKSLLTLATECEFITEGLSTLQDKLAVETKQYTVLEQELIRLMGLASIFTRSECAEYLSNFLSKPRELDSFKQLSYVQSLFMRLINLNLYLIEFAKRDFGIVTEKIKPPT